MSEWQPIESAPKNGAWVLGYAPAVNRAHPPVFIIQWDWNEWADDANISCAPTHWMPLPQPPVPS